MVLKFCIDADIIDCPEHILDKLPEYQNQFTDWLFDKNNDHPYWFYINGEKMGCCYRSEAFVNWLNEFILKDSQYKAKILEKEINSWDGSLPMILF